jgi:large subunit ribosomal protein L4
MKALDVLDFKTGNVVSKIELPEEVEQMIDIICNTPHYVDFMSNYLYRTKKISFVKTASTKTISEIKGTTKKPFKQKGTGNARQGSLRSPQFRGGANIFGPVPVTASYKINKKERILAKRILLSHLIDNSINEDSKTPKTSLIKVVENLEAVNKTKDFVTYKNAIVSESEKVIFVSNGGVEANPSYLAGRNVKGVSFDVGMQFNVYKVSNHETVVITKGALQELFSTLF